jgi:hypothetical protein
VHVVVVALPVPYPVSMSLTQQGLGVLPVTYCIWGDNSINIVVALPVPYLVSLFWCLCMSLVILVCASM